MSFECIHLATDFLIASASFRCDEKGARIVCVDQLWRNETQSEPGQSEIIHETA